MFWEVKMLKKKKYTNIKIIIYCPWAGQRITAQDHLKLTFWYKDNLTSKYLLIKYHIRNQI